MNHDEFIALINSGDTAAVSAAVADGRIDLRKLERAAYAALADGKWPVFAALHRNFDLLAVLDMKLVFEFWRCRVLTDERNFMPVPRPAPGTEEERNGFLRQWRDAENYPLHGLVVDWSADGRCVPALFRQGLLFPEVQTYLLERGIPLDRPLTSFKGWEEVTFPAFAQYFGALAPDFGRWAKTGAKERIFVANLQAAEFYREHIAPALLPGGSTGSA